MTAVRSTGIYRRPSCPARTPKESNDIEAARAAGVTMFFRGERRFFH